MNVVIAIDSFKGSMTSMQAGLSAATGIKRVYKDAHITVRPLADGGEGTVDALVNGCDGRMRRYAPGESEASVSSIIPFVFKIVNGAETALCGFSVTKISVSWESDVLCFVSR